MLRRLTCVNAIKFPNSWGMEPDSSFWNNLISSRLAKLPIEFGILPDNWLNARLRYFNLFKLPSSVGIEPFKLLFERFRLFRLVKYPISTGILPDNPELEKSKSITAVLGSNVPSSNNYDRKAKARFLSKGGDPKDFTYSYTYSIGSLETLEQSVKGLGSISFLDQTDGIIRSLPL